MNKFMTYSLWYVRINVPSSGPSLSSTPCHFKCMIGNLGIWNRNSNLQWKVFNYLLQLNLGEIQKFIKFSLYLNLHGF